MRSFILICGLLLAPARAVVGQVTVELSVDQKQFLAGEAIPLAVHVINHSGQTLHLGDDPNWLTFSVEAKDGFIVRKLDNIDVAGAFELPTSKTATKRVDLRQGYKLDQPGRYTIAASVFIKDWGRQIASEPLAVSLTSGAKLWEQEFGVPQPGGEPEVRRYVLQQANHDDRLVMYARVAGIPEREGDRVLPLGQMVSFAKPEVQLDRENNLHVLFQNGARSFAYRVVSPDGILLLSEIHDYSDSRPHLKTGSEGKPFISGGVRRPAPKDMPPPENSPIDR